LRPPGAGTNTNAPVPGIVKERADAHARDKAVHFSALQRLTDGSAASTVMQRFRDWRSANSQRSMLEQQEDFFLSSLNLLMASERWTFGAFLAYQRKLVDLMGGNSWRRRLGEQNKDVEFLEKQLKVLEAMNPVELASNHKSVFTKESIKLISEKSGVDSREFVDRVIFTHDALRADRKWFMIRQQFGKRLPRSMEERAEWAEYDRPPSQSENEYRQEYMEKEMKKVMKKGYKQRKILSIWPRKRSIGGNRWSIKPPKWYPTRWTNPKKQRVFKA